MSRTATATSGGRVTPVVVVLLVGAALSGVLLLDATGSVPPALSPLPGSASGAVSVPGSAGSGSGSGGEAVGEGGASGRVAGGVTPFDVASAIANLDPALRSALRAAATDAAGDGVAIQVNSGWRSPDYQARLLDKAIAEYGSREEAARWVATPETSPHVSGDAVDIGPSGATDWLSANGASYGLCQIYDNEPWHYELRPEAVDTGCPERYDDPTQDPRMQQ